MKLTKVSVTSDLHGESKNTPAWRCHLAVVKDFKPSIHIVIGDFMDAISVSAHPKTTYEQVTLGHEYDIGNQDLDSLESKLPDQCTKVYIMGNHEFRVNRYVANNAPELGGVTGLMVEDGLHLKNRGWKVVPYGGVYNVGRMAFVHGYWANLYHSAKHVNSLGQNIFYGHVHDHQVHSVCHGDKAHIGMSVGCLCDLKQDYLHGRPTRWSHGFLNAYVYPNRNFIYHYIPIVDGSTVWNNHVYWGV